MHAIVSILPGEHRQNIVRIWEMFRDEFGVKKIMEDPYPHFSWHLAENYRSEEVDGALHELTASKKKIHVKTSGLGIFTGANPVLFIPVVKTERILDLHADIWKSMSPIADNDNTMLNLSNYDPDNWIPHITLAFRDTDTLSIGDMVEALILEDFHWDFEVDNLAIAKKAPGENGRIVRIFNFNG